jgi:EAL domain-containing protein (putative c-di-GMP-specific phosphodiesterase class I)/GGDEF domain-containing protein
MIRKLSAVMVIIAILIFPLNAYAKVVTTKEPTNGSTIYIAGNPDMYPLEYFDNDSGKYKGIIPAMFDKLSLSSKIDFSYISSGDKNEQKRLAKNKQVEIVSVHYEKEAGKLKNETYLMSIKRDGKEKKVFIGFTDIASTEVQTAVKNVINSENAQEILKPAVDNSNDFKPEGFPYYLYIIIGGLISLVVILILVIIFIALKKRHSKQLQLEDKLTGIGNKDYFDYWFTRQITPSNFILYYIAYISIDIQKLSEYTNDKTSGEIQVFAAQTISSSAGNNDFCARVSDGVFLLAYQAPSKESAEMYIGELINKLNNNENENTERYNIHFRAGVFHLDTPNTASEKAALNAKLGNNYAQKEAKPYCFSDDKLLSREKYLHNLRQKLTTAISNDEFKLYVQYIFDAEKRCACGAEVLSRWHSVDNGIVYPSDYIHMLETANLITDLDYHNIENSCMLLEKWSKTDKSHLWLSCNLTRSTISDNSFIEKFSAILDKFTFNREQLVIEITEDMLAENNDAAVKNIAAGKKMGVRIALDDFGDGYSSIRDLSDYPIDIIKIDRRIVTKSVTSRGNSLLQGLVKLAHYLNILVLCEGVENKEELEVSIASECDFIQGFVYSKVYPADEPSIDKLINFKPVVTKTKPADTRPAKTTTTSEAKSADSITAAAKPKPSTPPVLSSRTPKTAKKTNKRKPLPVYKQKKGFGGLLQRRKQKKHQETLRLIDKYLD